MTGPRPTSVTRPVQNGGSLVGRYLIVMQSQAEFALIGSQVVLHEIRVLIDVDGFQGQLPQALSSIPVAL